MKVICISGKARHGKDTTAEMMKEALERLDQRVLVAHFGDTVKYVCKTFFSWNGMKDEAGRTLLQYVGTDKIRERFPNFWTDFIIDILLSFKDEWDYVLIPDCRFPNEYESFSQYGIDAALVRIERPDFVSDLSPEQLTHPSETAMDNYPYDFTVINSGSLGELQMAIESLVWSLIV